LQAVTDGSMDMIVDISMTNDKWYIKKLCIDNRVTLAPMAGFTDSPFRSICYECGVGYTTTELISCKGLIYDNEQTKKMLFVDPKERIVAVQLFGSQPSDFEQCIKSPLLDRFDIVDINMGCPVKKLTKNHEGSALMKDLNTAQKIVSVCAKNTVKPVTVKFRLGYEIGHFNALDFARAMQDSGASALTIHGRYALQMYQGSADWQKIGTVATKLNIPIVGNGDVCSIEQAKYCINTYGVKAVAIGRAALGNPEIFTVDSNQKSKSKKQVALRHLEYMQRQYGNRATILFRSHLSHYLKGIQNCKEYKQKANDIKDIDQLKTLLQSIPF